MKAAAQELLTMMAEGALNLVLSSNAPADAVTTTSNTAHKPTEEHNWDAMGYQHEQAEWENLNKLLRRHGLKPVSLAKPRSSGNLSDMVVLDKHSSLGIRIALKSLMEDTERQRKMMRGLIEDNHRLRDEVRLERDRASRQEQRASDLESVVENVQSKIRQLEDESIAKACRQQSHVKELQKDQEASQMKDHQQKQKLLEQEETIVRLQKELCKIGREEQERVATQKKMFCQFCKRAPKCLLDQQFLCLIDYYESQIKHMKKELRKYKKDVDHVQGEAKDKEEFSNLDATPNYRALLTSFQNQFIETKVRNEQLLCENTNLKKELETRATAQELKLYRQQVKRLEKILKRDTKSHENTREEKMKEQRESESITEDHRDEVCRKYLQVLSSIDAVLSSPRRASLVIYKQSKGPVRNWPKVNGQDCGFEYLPPTIEMWADQLMALKDVHRSLKKLLLELLPWHAEDPPDNTECIRIEDLLFIVDTILEEVENKEKNGQVPSLHTLHAIISHFQKLFDVTSLNGVYPRMNEVYTKLGEMTNAMRNLHDLLELDNCAPPSVLVNTVGKLCNIVKENVTGQVEQLLGTQDIQSIINKLEEHNDFFPAFQAFTQDLLHVLEVRNLDDILPAVRRLKLQSS
uniref:Centrosomal protein of 70 kDa n=1 Tax=Sphenodon punctatus TaxID=8508 RepID=A0A8D0HFV8_SPHPU